MSVRSMKSFFGGKACTREACAIRSLKPEAPSAAPSKAPAVQRKAAGSSTAGSKTATKGTQPRRAAPAAQKRRRSHYADFSELDDDTPGPSAPSTRIPTAVCTSSEVLSYAVVSCTEPSEGPTLRARQQQYA